MTWQPQEDQGDTFWTATIQPILSESYGLAAFHFILISTRDGAFLEIFLGFEAEQEASILDLRLPSLERAKAFAEGFLAYLRSPLTEA